MGLEVKSGGFAGRRSGYGWIPLVRKEETPGDTPRRSDDGSPGDPRSGAVRAADKAAGADIGGEQQRDSGASGGHLQSGSALSDAKSEVIYNSVHISIPWLQINGAVPTKPVSEMTDTEREAVMHTRLEAYSNYVRQHDRLNNLIELLLTEARDAANADGGTFYIVSREGWLRFAYFQNDTLSSASDSSAYKDSEIFIDNRSICGYAAKTASILNVKDVAAIPEDEPYRFNRSYDDATGYRTVSLLTIPMLGADGHVIAVMQLVNKLDGMGKPVAFSGRDVMYSRMLASKSATLLLKAIEREHLYPHSGFHSGPHSVVYDAMHRSTGQAVPRAGASEFKG